MRNKIASIPEFFFRPAQACGKYTLKTQRGVSLILVLFLIVVVGLLAAALAQLNRGGSNSVSLETQSTRALFAAESGAQIAAMKIFPIGNNNLDASGNCAGFTQAFVANGLNNCSATVACNPVTPVGASNTVYKIDSTGVCGSGGDYARRKITVEMRSL